MFVVLDTNHFTEVIRESEAGARLARRLIENEAEVFVSIITAQESLEGWLAVIKSHPPGSAQVKGYSEFRKSIDTLGKFSLLDFDLEAAEAFSNLRKLFPRVGTLDIKIAAISLAHDCLLLTRNLRDFNQVPGRCVENWLD